AIASTSRQTGSALGVATAGALAAAAPHSVWWLVVGLGGAIVALGVLSTSAWARRTARRVAQLLEEP
ncbi:MAG TPA: MFS transporter, partial [Polyangia bacterium]|nr:MFS transporter [Polyangia bacterium]